MMVTDRLLMLKGGKSMTGDTKERIRETALELFSEKGYPGTSMSDIAGRMGLTKAALYKHYAGKQEIFDAIVEATAARYQRYTDQIDIHVQDAGQDFPVFTEISADALAEKVRQIFLYSLHDEAISRFRRMMTIEQFRSQELSGLYTRRYVERMVDYHAAIFRSLISAGELREEDPETLAMMYVAPVITLLGVCDREPEKEAECLVKLDAHVRLFYRTFHTAP